MKKSITDLLAECEGFDWGKGNQVKNQAKHAVTPKEAEEVFLNQPQVIFYDPIHSQAEERYGILGITDEGRKLAVFFTLRNNRIRVISARDQSKTRERQRFEQKQQQEAA